MKKTILLIFCIIIIILSVIYTKYINYKSEKNEIKKFNLQYEAYLNKQILGTELTTVINKAVDNNERNKVQKDKNDVYIEDDKNSIKIDIKTIDFDEEVIYNMESFYSRWNDKISCIL